MSDAGQDDVLKDRGSHSFTTTHWSVVLAAGGAGSPQRAEALARLRHEYDDASKGVLYEKLNPFLLGDKPAETCAELAQQLNMSEVAVRMAVTRLRQRCRAALHHA